MDFKILEEEKTCWRISRASRAAVLIDADDYFRAVYESISQARQYVLMTGWEFDSRFHLLRGEDTISGETRFRRFLDETVKARPDLNIYILAWDYSMVFAMEREPLPLLQLGWNTHKRIHFRLDGEHPLGGSHHQKIVVVDGELAFVGGLDLTKRRWDTSEHNPDNPLRVDPSGIAYGPFHDVQMMVEGRVVSDLTEIFLRRWKRGTGKTLELPEPYAHDIWPETYAPEFHNVRIGISRTEPAFKARKEIREIQTLYTEAIKAAQRYIYIENQYLTAPVIQEALSQRLRSPDCPEIAIIVPHQSRGWLEEKTLDLLRDRLLKKLFEDDRHGRLGVFYPHVDGLTDTCIKVHSKVMIVDDRLLSVGSANLNNRSMGLDTECNLTIESTDEKCSRSITRIVSRLLADHCALPLEKLESVTTAGSLLNTIRAQKGVHRLVEFDPDEIQARPDLEFDMNYLDPEQPTRLDKSVDRFIPEDGETQTRFRLLKFSIALLILLGLAAAWRWTPLSSWVEVDTLLSWADFLGENRALAPPIVLGAYIIGGLTMFPVTVLIAATAAIFNPVETLFYAYIGSVLSAVTTYWIGWVLGRETIRRMAGSTVNNLSRRIATQGILTVTLVRMLPIAPFSLVNMVAGASHISFLQYLVGTVLGMTPGILAITIFTEGLVSFLRNPDWGNFGILVIVSVLMIVAGIWMKKRLRRT
ncbi:MAG: VTT domain-containing protein [bacterium]